MTILKGCKEIVVLTYDMFRDLNQTFWGSKEKAEAGVKSIQNGITGADVIIGTSHALEDFACNDPFCGTLDVVGSVSSALGLVLGNIPSTQHLSRITCSVTIGCRSVRYYCKNYGTFWGCTVAAGQGVKEVIKVTIKP